jgi:hypothetical protein
MIRQYLSVIRTNPMIEPAIGFRRTRGAAQKDRHKSLNMPFNESMLAPLSIENPRRVYRYTGLFRSRSIYPLQ